MARRDSGFWPYLLPYLAFGLAVEFGDALPPLLALALRAIVPGGLVLGFARTGAYPELRGYRPGAAAALDVGVGLGIAALWVAPFLLVPELPRGEGDFDPGAQGPAARPALLALRALGFAGVTPFVEELFVRSFLHRLADGWRARVPDFRTLPVGRFTGPGFVVTVLWFTFTHAPWEWIVAAPTGVVLNLWLYRRGHLGAVVLAHAVANAAIFALVVAGPFPLAEFL